MAVTKRTRYEVLRRDNHTCRYCGAAAPEVKLQVDHVVPEALGGSDDPSNLVTACADCNAGKASTIPGAELVADVREDALRWAKAMDAATRIQKEQADYLQLQRDDLAMAWELAFTNDTELIAVHEPTGWHYTKDPARTYEWIVREYDVKTWDDDTSTVPHLADTEEEAEDWIDREMRRRVPPKPDDWDASVAVWSAAGLTSRDFHEAALIAKRATHIHWETRYRYFCGVIWRKLEDRQRIALDLLAKEDTDAE